MYSVNIHICSSGTHCAVAEGVQNSDAIASLLKSLASVRLPVQCKSK